MTASALIIATPMVAQSQQLYGQQAPGFLLGVSSRSHHRTGYRRSTAIARAASNSSTESTSGEKSNSDAPPTARKEALRSSSGPGELDRRQLLVATAAGISMAASTLEAPGSLRAAPIDAPDPFRCVLATYYEGLPTDPPNPGLARSIQCCPPLRSSVKIVNFKLKPFPVRERKAAHTLTDKEKARYQKAYARIRELPDDHPHSLHAQANVHCAYCNYGYFQQDGITPLQVHNNWLFLPFHRWYLYFHERILAHYAEDEDFRLPFWNWDNQEDPVGRPAPSEIPAVFLDYPSLTGIRNPAHYPPNIVNFARTEPPPDRLELRQLNTALIRQNIVDGPTTSSLFFGGAYRAGDPPPGALSTGSLEELPHGPPHGWTGGSVDSLRSPAGEDMGNFYSAGRDPLFYAHHSNVDRMWTIWKTLGNPRLLPSANSNPLYEWVKSRLPSSRTSTTIGSRGGRQDPDDPDFLNSSFLFYDADERLVRVFVRDCLSNERLGYKYAPANAEWLDPPRRVPLRPREGERRRRQGVIDVIDAAARAAPAADSFRIQDSAEGSTFRLSRPDRPQRRGTRRSGNRSSQPVVLLDDDGAEELEEEILVIKGVTVPADRTISFDVYLNLDDGVTGVADCLPNYVGSFYNVGHTAPPGGPPDWVTDLRFGITSTLQALTLTDASDLDITLVTRDALDSVGATKVIAVTGFSLEYE